MAVKWGGGPEREVKGAPETASEGCPVPGPEKGRDERDTAKGSHRQKERERPKRDKDLNIYLHSHRGSWSEPWEKLGCLSVPMGHLGPWLHTSVLWAAAASLLLPPAMTQQLRGAGPGPSNWNNNAGVPGPSEDTSGKFGHPIHSHRGQVDENKGVSTEGGHQFQSHRDHGEEDEDVSREYGHSHGLQGHRYQGHEVGDENVSDEEVFTERAWQAHGHRGHVNEDTDDSAEHGHESCG